MDSVKSFFANPNKEGNLGNQQNGVAAGRWTGWNRSLQGHTDPGSVRNGAMRDANSTDPKRKDSDNYFYIMWVNQSYALINININIKKKINKNKFLKD